MRALSVFTMVVLAFAFVALLLTGSTGCKGCGERSENRQSREPENLVSLELRYRVDYRQSIQDTIELLGENIKVKLAEEIMLKRDGYLDQEDIKKDVHIRVLEFNKIALRFGNAPPLQAKVTQSFIDKIDVGYKVSSLGDAVIIELPEEEVMARRDEIVNATFKTMKRRVNSLDLYKPNLRKSGDADISLQWSGASVKANVAVRKFLEIGPLTFRIVDSPTNFFQKHRARVDAFKATEIGKNSSVKYEPAPIAAFTADTKAELVQFINPQFLQIPCTSDADCDNVSACSEMTNTCSIVPMGRMIAYERRIKPGGDVETTSYMTRLVRKRIEFSGEHVVQAVAGAEESGEWVVWIDLNETGARLLEKTTREHTGELLAIMFGDEVNSAPIIRETIFGGRIQVSMGGNRSVAEMKNEAKSLARVLMLGVYKAPIRLDDIAMFKLSCMCEELARHCAFVEKDCRVTCMEKGENRPLVFKECVDACDRDDDGCDKARDSCAMNCR